MAAPHREAANDRDPIRRRHDVLLHYRVAAVCTDLLEIATLLEHANDPDPVYVKEIHRLLTSGDSPLYHPGAHVSELYATLYYIRAGLSRATIPPRLPAGPTQPITGEPRATIPTRCVEKGRGHETRCETSRSALRRTLCGHQHLRVRRRRRERGALRVPVVTIGTFGVPSEPTAAIIADSIPSQCVGR